MINVVSLLFWLALSVAIMDKGRNKIMGEILAEKTVLLKAFI